MLIKCLSSRHCGLEKQRALMLSYSNTCEILEDMLFKETVDDWHRVIINEYPEHVVLRWAKILFECDFQKYNKFIINKTSYD